jgi:S1-C subfamily serine protease/predicted esterase
MTMNRPLLVAGLLTALGVAAAGTTWLVAQAPASPDELLEQATRAAVEKVAPSVVQIRTVGGLETIGGGKSPALLRGQGPTTGVIVAPDGYIISSSFNFAHKPSAITVSIPGHKEPYNARVVAQDETRMLTLLKIEATNLPVPAAAPKKDLKIGQWALALGRTWSESANAPPSVSLGVISALDRVWGKAVQTDAKVSPVNYGGPLVDIRGRVIGILVPMSPRAEGETAGVEWYDSGIGFAVPLEDVNRVLPQLKQGKTLRRGTVGFAMQGQDLFSAQPVIAAVEPNSAAAKAGLQPGDIVVAMDGKPVVRQAQIRHILGPKYEGEKVTITVKRGDKELEFKDLVLGGPASGTAVPAWLGILPVRDDPAPGVEVRYVFPKSPADQAGIKPGDRIMQINGARFAGRDQFLQRFAALAPGTEVKLEVQRKGGEKTETIAVKLGELTDGQHLIPEELPNGTARQALTKPKPPGPKLPGKPEVKPPEKPAEKKDARIGLFTQKNPTTGREYWVYVPEDYDPNVSYALMVWLHPAGNPMERDISRLWAELCRKHHIIILGPKAENPTGWLTSEADDIKNDMREILAAYTIDRQKVFLHGMGNGGNLALYLAFDARDLVRGAATVGGVLTNPPKEHVPGQRLSFFLIAGTKDPAYEAIKASQPPLAEKRYPVIYRELPGHGNGYINDAELLRELARWADALDRI